MNFGIDKASVIVEEGSNLYPFDDRGRDCAYLVMVIVLSISANEITINGRTLYSQSIGLLPAATLNKIS